MKQKTYLLSLLLFTISCHSEKPIYHTRNGGSYQISVKNDGSNHNPIFYGNFYDKDENLPLVIAVVRFPDRENVKADRTGKFKFSGGAGKYQLVGRAMPYLDCKVKTINAKLGDSIKVVFFLKPVSEWITKNL